MLNWQLGHSDAIGETPSEFVCAWVPSDVQLVWKECKGMSDYNFGKNYLEYKWMEDKFWHYKATIVVEKRDGFVPMLTFKSIDYRYTIIVNGKTERDDEGMFTPVQIDLSEYAGTTVNIEVIIHPIPKTPGASESREQANLSCKPAVSYGWDWHPRLVPSGISDDVLFDYLPETRFFETDFSYNLNSDFTKLSFRANVAFWYAAGTELSVKVALIDREGSVAAESVVPVAMTDGEREVAKKHPAPMHSVRIMRDLTVDNPKLWWCKNHGEQYLYTYKASLIAADGTILHESSRSIGFRSAKLKVNGDDWFDDGFPATQANFPITMELNGRRIFCKGTNFVPTEIFYSLMTEDVYRSAVALADECNMNILRIWGGGLTNRDVFFDICDEAGIMVWQEFPLACNNYIDDPHYLKVLDKESISIIQRVKSHPSLVMWCGGNELFNGWSGMTNQSHALRILNRNCFNYDPNTPYIMTSPLYGMGHGCYLNILPDGRDAVTSFIDKHRTAYTEFGAPSPAPLDYIKQYIPESEVYVVEEGTSWEHHHAFNAWIDRETWFRPKEIETFYGEQDTLESLIECGLELQGQTYKSMFEECRRKWPRTSMAANWCFNEPWPCFANNSLVMYPDVKRPAYYDVQNSLRDRMISVRACKLRFEKGEQTKFEFYALNDLPDAMESESVCVFIKSGEDKIDLGTYRYPKIDGTSSVKFGEIVFTVPENIAPAFTLCAEAENGEYSSNYKLYCPVK